MSCWGTSFFLVLKRPFAYIMTGLVLTLSVWKSYDIVAWFWKRCSAASRLLTVLGSLFVVAVCVLSGVSSQVHLHIMD
jgi:hypothetical protein